MRILIVVLTIFSILFSSRICWGQSNSSASLSIVGPSGAVRIGDPIDVAVSLQNSLPSVVTYWLESNPLDGEKDFYVSVFDREGNKLSYTDYAKTLYNEIGGGRGHVLIKPLPPTQLNPGDVFKRNIDLSKLVNIDKSGVYTVVAEFDLAHEDSPVIGGPNQDAITVRSNVITIDVSGW